MGFRDYIIFNPRSRDWEFNPRIAITNADGFKEVDVALLKLYAESDSSDLMSTLMSCCSHLTDAGVADCADWLSRCSRHHAVGLLHHFHGDDAAALGVWTRHVSWLSMHRFVHSHKHAKRLTWCLLRWFCGVIVL